MHCLLCKHFAGEVTECEPIDGYAVCEDHAHDECLFDETQYSEKGLAMYQEALDMEAKEASLKTTTQDLSGALKALVAA